MSIPTKPPTRWVCCISRMNIQAGLVPGLKVCKGSKELKDTHCYQCEFWAKNRQLFGAAKRLHRS